MIGERTWLAAAVRTHASRCFLALLCWLAYGLGCGVNGEPHVADGDTAPRLAGSSSAPPSEAELIEQLSAIGYFPATDQAGDVQGITVHDPQRTAPGLNLITSGHGPVAATRILLSLAGT